MQIIIQNISKYLHFSTNCRNFVGVNVFRVPKICKILLLSLAVVLLGCGRPSQPRPYGYHRIDIPEYGYRQSELPGYPYRFEYADIACIDTTLDYSEPYWVDIFYPTLNARIHCSYKRIERNPGLGKLTDDAIRFVFDHAIKADAIPEQGFSHPEQRVYGVYYDLEGNTASPVQFFLTDSTRHFFRAALYYNAIPDADSLAPVNEVLRKDIHHLIETFRWQNRK